MAYLDLRKDSISVCFTLKRDEEVVEEEEEEEEAGEEEVGFHQCEQVEF